MLSEDAMTAAQRETLQAFWSLKREMQRRIDASIQKNAPQEELVDQPEKESGIVRVSGPFTMEAVPNVGAEVSATVETYVLDSPLPAPEGEGSGEGVPVPLHITLFEPGQPSITVEAKNVSAYLGDMIEKLRKVGVETKSKHRLTFASLRPLDHAVLHAEGEIANGETKRAAVLFGPPNGSISESHVRDALRSSRKYDVLLLCGYDFTAAAQEMAQSNSGEDLQVLLAYVAPDTVMGDLLKDTKASQLFTMVGEPDLRVESGEWLVDSGGKPLVLFDVVKELSGIGSLEEVNRLGGANPSAVWELAERGAVRLGLTDAKGSGLGGKQHRGGSRAPGAEGVSALSVDSAGIAGGTGDAGDFGETVRLPDSGADGGDAGGDRSDRKDDWRFAAVASLKALNASHYPLSTEHYVRVTVRGVDLYDPVTGNVSSDSGANVHAVFIDHDYDGKSFCICQALFPNKKDSWDKIARNLKGTIDEDAFAAFRTLVSLPFKPGTSYIHGQEGRVQVKVIDTRGNAVVKTVRP